MVNKHTSIFQSCWLAYYTTILSTQPKKSILTTQPQFFQKYLNRPLTNLWYLYWPLARFWVFFDMFPQSKKDTFFTLRFQT